MWMMIARGLAAGFVLVAVAEIAGRWQRWSALILTLPIAIPLVFLMMYFKTGQLPPISRLSRETLMLIPLWLPFFIPMAVAPRWGLSFWTAFITGVALVVVTISLYLWLAPEA